MPVDVQLARQEWEEGYRRLRDLERDPAASNRLHAEVDAVLAELRRRVGATFDLAQLARAYAGADEWARDAIEEGVEHAGWVRTASLAADAAFHLYARGATDYRP
jgi:hypothetical protein